MNQDRVAGDGRGLDLGEIIRWKVNSQKMYQEDLESMIGSQKPTAEEVTRLAEIRNQFLDVRRVLDEYRLFGDTDTKPETDISTVEEFKELLEREEEKVESYFSRAINDYKASVMLDRKVLIDTFGERKKRFDEVLRYISQYDNERIPELEELNRRVSSIVKERLKEEPKSRFFIPHISMNEDPEYQQSKLLAEKKIKLLESPKYQPKSSGATKRLGYLKEELETLLLEASMNNYDYADEVKSAIVEADILQKESEGRDKRKHNLRVLAGIGFIAVSLSLAYRVFDLDLHRREKILEAIKNQKDSYVGSIQQRREQPKLPPLEESLTPKHSQERSTPEEFKREESKVKEPREEVYIPKSSAFDPPGAHALEILYRANHLAHTNHSTHITHSRNTNHSTDSNYSINNTAKRAMKDYNADVALYINRKELRFTLYDRKMSNKVIYSGRCTGGKRPGNKKRSGDKRTQEGVFRPEKIGIGHFSNLYGDAFINLEDKPYKGLQVAGTNLEERLLAIDRGENSTNGGMVMRNEDSVKVAKYIKNNGLDNSIIIIEDPDHPLYRRRG